MAELTGAGLAARAVAPIDEAATYLADRGVAYFEPGPTGPQPMPGVGSWLSETPPVNGPNPRPVGGQILEILGDLGLSFEEIVVLDGEGVVCLPDDLPSIDVWT